jgi:hypothetical protein
MISAWVNRVGGVEETLHWVKNSLFSRVNCVKYMTLPNMARELQCNSALWAIAYGVMDVMFVTSCFQLPVMQRMGDLFWVFAKEIINLRIQSGDMLNSLLWGMVLPQTIICLPHTPTGFVLDSLLDPISVDVTIQGCERSAGRTVIYVYSHTSLTFLSGARLNGITFVHRASSSPMAKVGTVLQFCGWKLSPLEVFMNDVVVECGGVCLSDYHVVHCNHLFVRNAPVGVSVSGVNRLFITGISIAGISGGDNTGFDSCETALRIRNVCEVSLGRIVVSNCARLFDAEVGDIFVFGNSMILKCGEIGSILMPVGRRASFINLVVCLCSPFLSALMRWLIPMFFPLQAQQLPRWANGGAEKMDAFTRVLLIARAPKCSACRLL